MAMRVRLQTSPLGMCARIVTLVVVGGLAAVVVEHSDWYQMNVATPQQTAAVTQPAPAPAPTPVPTPTAAKATAVALPLAPAASTPPGWTNFLGILIPPPGWNDTPHN